MKIKTIINSIDDAIGLSQTIYNNTIEKVEEKKLSIAELDEIKKNLARHFAMIDNVINEYGRRNIPFGQDARETDMFRATLSFTGYGGHAIINDCIAELRLIREKLLIEYNDDLDKELRAVQTPRLLEVASKFEYWLKNYDHHGASHSESFKNFITHDKALGSYGVTYDEYKTLAEILKQNGVEIKYIIPENAYNEQVEISKLKNKKYLEK